MAVAEPEFILLIPMAYSTRLSNWFNNCFGRNKFRPPLNVLCLTSQLKEEIEMYMWNLNLGWKYNDYDS
jgi:hypothetical protein